MELSLHYETWIVLQLFLGDNQPLAKLTSSIILVGHCSGSAVT